MSEIAGEAWKADLEAIRAARPRHFLFLCVANSARSQMAEGIARSLAPAGVQVSSAGSAPTKVRPQAMAALREIGIDLSTHVAKHVSAIDPKSVDVVVTLCGEEECPLFLGKALRVHWGLPDPAAVTGSEEAQLDAFRKVRDELSRRLGALFSSWPTKEENR
ncbi:MAG: arsenate reductase ArsC [Myxococcales bacterium]